ncbi:(Fe-S)-binding protein [Methanosalsum natronophilum]|uniref:(Fe-S)-binding protein n=1 Tax=Methanosalsum natronophilum TaxID=768733 RepID=UPI00216921BA|nr:(Fe-S)-binding protein [Methanosalsum natronophilum]MCS3923621.1 putative Fe-S cluster-containing protein [Methanosalsum natronophilum]
MKDIESLLPGYNCGSCGYSQCREFVVELESSDDLKLCPFLVQDRFSDNLDEILDLMGEKVTEQDIIIGVIDGLEADFTLAPLRDECSCREDIHPFDTSVDIGIDDILRYRPLGCPVTHFAKVIDIVPGGIYTVHMVGPMHRLGVDDFTYKDVGLSMILAFDGIISRGKIPKMGQTVKFVPEYCMMQKVHSGMVVSVEGKKVRIEAIDLKVW